jgi:hypothetical protein
MTDRTALEGRVVSVALSRASRTITPPPPGDVAAGREAPGARRRTLRYYRLASTRTPPMEGRPAATIADGAGGAA